MRTFFLGLMLLVGTILAYVFYWMAVIVTLLIMKFKEVSRAALCFSSLMQPFFKKKGRTKLFGRESAAARRHREYCEATEQKSMDVATPEQDIHVETDGNFPSVTAL